MHRRDYYQKTLAAERLQRVYDLASPRVRQYLEAEVEHVLSKVELGDLVLELGCGYGRALPDLAAKAELVIGIDNAAGTLLFGRDYLSGCGNCLLACAEATQLAFANDLFDLVFCIQNGISAFHVDQQQLLAEALRVTKPGGTALFSSYSDKFWEERLSWFHRQAEAGLLGEIDPARTGGGVIVCKDGFTATTITPDRFLELAAGLDVTAEVVEVDQSSVFLQINKP